MRVLATLLIVLGLVALAYSGASYESEETLIDAGPVEVTTEKTNRVPLPPVFGGVTIAAGIVMLVLSWKH